MMPRGEVKSARSPPGSRSKQLPEREPAGTDPTDADRHPVRDLPGLMGQWIQFP